MSFRVISVIEPVGRAFTRVNRMLFAPFDPAKWFVIGFCAWLAFLGRGGGGGFPGFGGDSHNKAGSLQEFLQQARDYVAANLYWLLPVAIFVFGIMLIFWVAILWLSSRGRFMFLYCVAEDRAEISIPWHRYGREALSLFWFRFVLGLISLIVSLPMLGLTAVLVVKMMMAGHARLVGVLLAVLMALVLVCVWAIVGVIAKLTEDFVVPIQYLRRVSTIEGWRALLGLVSANVGNFILYLLFQIVIGIGIGAAALALILVTCCIAGCLLAIPYLGTVLLLPVLIFQRAYSLYYLAQYGRDFDVFPWLSSPPAAQ